MNAKKPLPRGAGQPKEWSGSLRKRRSSKIDDPTQENTELKQYEIQRIKAELEGQLTSKIRREVRLELKKKERARIEQQVRAEFIAKAKVDLDPARILNEFSATASLLLSEMSHSPGDPKRFQQVSTVLRQSVLEAFRIRKLHMSQLVEMDRSVRHGITASQLSSLMEDLLARAGIRRVASPDNIDFFIKTNGGGIDDCFEVVEPAYVDATNGQLLLPGQVVSKIVGPSDDSAGIDRKDDDCQEQE